MKPFDPRTLDEAGAVFVDDCREGSRQGRSYLFRHPEDVIVARALEEVDDALVRLDHALDAGRFAAGYLAYDAGLVLDKTIPSRHPHPPGHAIPLIWLGLYPNAVELDAATVDLGPPGRVEDVSEARLNVSDEEYLERVARVKDYILAGDVYQINYTVKLLFERRGPARDLFARLRRAHPVAHAAFVNIGPAQIVSLSPELFLRRRGRRVLSRPMKGTARRGRWPQEDADIANALQNDEKNRAENVMIVDLMRNDLGRVCGPGDDDDPAVGVPRLFHVERYDSLFQMTSDVEGRLRDGVRASELLRAAFPPGSVTGAPKIRAMEIIDELERAPRGVYCGSIGFFHPNGDALLNVAIRTIVQQGQACQMGLGSGIVADSDPRAELAETRLKGRFLRAEPAEFSLLETILWSRHDGFAFLQEHLDRMARSADYFGWTFPEDRLKGALRKVDIDACRHAERFTEGRARVRLLLAPDGHVDTQWADAGPDPPRPVRLLLASRRTDPEDRFLYHKSTRRQGYDQDFERARRRGYFDCLYLNSRGEVTEGAITNAIAHLDGKWVTPPLECGLLPGIWRASRVASGEVLERIVTADDLRRAARVVVGNSVRGEVEVDAIETPGEGTPLFRRADPARNLIDPALSQPL